MYKVQDGYDQPTSDAYFSLEPCPTIGYLLFYVPLKSFSLISTTGTSKALDYIFINL
jgi:hypothetical protein